MKRILLATVIFALAALSAYSQTQTPSAGTSACRVAVTQAPAIRGVKLGMKMDEVLALFPGSAENNDIKSAIAKAQGFPNFGLASLYLIPSQYSTKDRFAGISSFRVTFVDGRLNQYEVEYESPPGGPVWRRVDDWITKLSDSFKLPPASTWAADQNLSDRKSLTCDGFQVRASNMNFRGNLSVSTLDTPLQKQMERRAAYEEKLRREFKPE
ncbi:MAG: hypothetical protein AABM67_03250 [Acidobacteriota bacterium]